MTALLNWSINYFDHTLEGKEIREWLLTVTQGKWSAAEYALEVCTLTAGNGWNEAALKATFRQGLNSEVLKELEWCDDKVSLDSLIDLSIHFDNLVRN